MEDAGILYVASCADPDAVDVAAQQAVEPNICARPEFHVPDNGSVWSNKYILGQFGMFSLIIQNHFFRPATDLFERTFFESGSITRRDPNKTGSGCDRRP